MPASPKQQNTPEMRNIQRKDDKIYGWKVAFSRRGKILHKYFTDSEWGDSVKALTAAQSYRDEAVQMHTDVDYAVWRREYIRPQNTSGHTGVHRGAFNYSRGKLLKTPTIMWQAYWQDINHKRQTRAFSAGRYGEEGAKQLAIQARADGMAQFAREVAFKLLTEQLALAKIKAKKENLEESLILNS
jgi:AP2 domain